MKNQRRNHGLRAVSLLLLLLLLFPQAAAAADAGRYYPACDRSYASLVDALKSVGAPSSFEDRTRIAEANGLKDYRGTERQNLTLLRLLICGWLRRPEAAAPLSANLDKVGFLRQEPKTCKASSVAMALNLLRGSDEDNTETMGGTCCRGIDGEVYEGSDGRRWRATYRTDGYVGSYEELIEAIDAALTAGVPAVAAVHSTRGGTQHHWVLILGRSGEDYLIADPAQAGRGSIGDNAVTMASRGYAFGLADYDTLHYGYVTFLRI